MKEFNITEFEVIGLTKRGLSEMQLNRRYISFTKGLLEEMGWPPYVRVLVNARAGVFAIQVCRANDENAYLFSKPKTEQRKAKYVASIPIKSSLITALGDKWSEDGYFGFPGTYFPDDKAMVFELKEGYKRTVFKKA